MIFSGGVNYYIEPLLLLRLYTAIFAENRLKWMLEALNKICRTKYVYGTYLLA